MIRDVKRIKAAFLKHFRGYLRDPRTTRGQKERKEEEADEKGGVVVCIN